MLLIVGGLVAFSALAVVTVFSLLRSPAFYTFLMPRIAAPLAANGLHLETLGEARIDLLGSIVIRDLRLQWTDPELGELHLSLGLLDFSCPLETIIRGQPRIDRLILKQVSLTGSLHPPPAAPQPQTDWDVLAEKLAHPPISMEVNDFTVQGLEVDLRLGQDDRWQRVYGRVGEAGAEMSWQPEGIRGAFRLRVDQDENRSWILAQGGGEEFTELAFYPSVNLGVAWELSYGEGNWRVDSTSAELQAVLDRVMVTQMIRGEKQKAGSLAAITLDLNTRAESGARPQTVGGWKTIFPLEVTVEVNDVARGVALDGLDIGPYTFDVRADHSFSLRLAGSVHPFEKPAPVISFQVEEDLTVERLAASGQDGSLFELTDLTWNLRSKGETPLDTDLESPVLVELHSAGKAQHVAIELPDQEGGKIAASLVPIHRLEGTGRLSSLADPLHSLVVEFAEELMAEDLLVTVGDQTYRSERQMLNGKGGFENGRVNYDGTMDLARALIPQIPREVSLQARLSVATDLDLAESRFSASVVLDTTDLLTAELTAENRPGILRLSHTVGLELDPELVSYLPETGEVFQFTGGLSVAASGALEFRHGMENIQQADPSAFSSWPIATSGDLRIVQQSPPVSKDGVVLTGPLEVVYSVGKESGYDTDLHIKTAGVQFPPLEKTLSVEIGNRSHFPWPPTSMTSDGEIVIDGKEALHYTLVLDDSPRRFSIASGFTVTSTPDWQAYLAPLKSLETVGAVIAKVELAAMLDHPQSSIQEFDPGMLDGVRAEIQLKTELIQSPDQRGTLVHWSKPAIINPAGVWSQEEMSGGVTFGFEDLELIDQAFIDRLSGGFSVKASPGRSPELAELTLHLDQGELRLAEAVTGGSALELGPLVTPLDFQVVGGLKGELASLTSLNLDAATGLLGFTAKGQSFMDGRDIQLESTLRAHLPSGFFPAGKPFISGLVEVPWRLTVMDGRRITLEGDFRFKDVAVGFDTVRLEGVNGSIKVEEELIRDEQGLGFRYLVTSDPFQTADFGRIQPYLDERHILSVKELQIDTLRVGPILAATSLKQNMIRLQRFDVDLFDGHLTGQFYLDAKPDGQKIGLLARVSQLDPRRLLKGRESGEKDQVYAPVNARVAVELDVKKRLVEGRIDIQDISREQLLQLLEIIDPQYQNEQLAQVRSALRLAYPQRVSVAMARGLMDLEVVISLLPKPLQVRGLPLTPLIQRFAGTTFEAIEQLSKEVHAP
ncbi:MAG: hypothetical protein KJ950_13305 [Proteobacteria bacterium]|nr:hypothetical protein [Pseudomonadota bacterium]MBU1686148.1 hypothetical protein [Pseudomonadota bacterium]